MDQEAAGGREEDSDGEGGGWSLYRVRDYADQILFMFVRALNHFRCGGLQVQERLMRRLVTVLAASLSHHIRIERERYQALGKSALTKSRDLALMLDGEVVFLMNTLSDFTTRSSADKSSEAPAAAAALCLNAVQGWLAECGLSSAGASSARKAALREASFRSGLLISCFSLHK